MALDVMTKGEITTLFKATPKSISLRTTVPEGVVRHVGLKPGDKLDWSIEARDGGLIITVRKVKV